MKNFDSVRFAGKFRTYQQAVLDKSAAHLRDGHVHIVAAPGSGKTILGLELCRRIGKPVLILAPSVTIRRQWGERFAESFLPKGAAQADYVSEDLHAPSLLTCVTYQALHAAMQRTALPAGEDAEAADNETAQDFTGFDLLQTLQQTGVGCVCLDEAHHLRREWQKALEQLLEALGRRVQVIALTATPPYDSTPAEWESYIRVCGEVDEEIFVPQLVAQKTLCPHQDYLFFNMPTESESAVLQAHRARALDCAAEVQRSGLLRQAWDICRTSDKNLPDSAALSLAAQQQSVSLSTLQAAVTCVMSNESVFGQAIPQALGEILSRCGMLEKGKVCLRSTDKLDRMLLASAGKLESIRRILASETAVLGEEMRALILTDYIRKEQLPLIGSDEPLTVMGAVPVFEAARRTVGRNVPIALLSGTLVILPNDVLEEAKQCAEKRGIAVSARPLEKAPYSVVQFAGSNKNKVSVLTELFGKGRLRVLIGTASLLGEGWDAPSINTLILASCVGSFMLTNQMRGRAIRIDKTKPEKASNIWHLVTVNPPEEAADDPGADFDVMERRFMTFLAPAYDEPWIESGTDRLSLPRVPFAEDAMRTLNAQMLERAQNRDAMAARWREALGSDSAPQVLDVCELPMTAYSSVRANRKRLHALIFAAVFAVLLVLPLTFTRILSAVPLLLSIVQLLAYRKAKKPANFFRAAGEQLLQALQKQKALQSGGARVFVLEMPERGCVCAALENAAQHDKMIFSRAMGTLFSAIDDPRYVLLPEGRDASEAHAVPAAFDRRKEDAQLLAACMEPVLGKTQTLYTRAQSGARTLQQCREQCRLNQKNCAAKYKKIVVRADRKDA